MAPTQPAPGPDSVAVRRLARRYYAYKGTVTFGFITPIFVLFLLLRDLNFAQIATLSAVNWAVVTLGEIPTGYVGDRVGRRNSLLLSTGFATASILGFIVATTFPAFVVLYVFWALSIAFRSGSESAWLYEALEGLDARGQYATIKGRGGAVRRWVGAAAMVAGGLLYIAEPTWPFATAAGLHLLGVPLLLILPPGRADRATDHLSLSEVVPIVRRTLTRPPLRAFVSYVALLVAAVSAAATYVQPITISVLETHLVSLSVGGFAVPEQATLGFLYAGFTAVEAVASDAAGTVERRVGRERAILALVPVVGFVLLSAAVVPVLAVPAFVTIRAGETLIDPLASHYLNDHLTEVGRATVLSAASMAYATVRIPLILIGGVVADATTPLVAVGLFGVVAVVGAGLVLVVERPV